MRKQLIVGNWKMNLNASQASLLLHRLEENVKIHRDIEVVLAPSMLVLQPLSVSLDRRKFRLAAQNAYHKDEGAYTGEVSFTMLRELVHYTIIGHSERRHIFNEDLPMVRDKVAACIRNGITPILVIAYEPVWAIGTGDVAKPGQVKEAVDYIRSYVRDVFGPKQGEEVRILYGGSVVPDVVHGFLNVQGVDGFLVGGASLNYHSFSEIINATHRWQRDKED
jgi:triosephosphate isomerase